MKKFLLIFLALIVVILVGGVYLLSNPSVLDKQIKSELASYHVKYEKLEGGIFSDMIIEGFNYEDRIKADKVLLNIDLKLLSQNIVKIDSLELENLWIDESFFDTNSSKSKGEDNSSLPIKKLIVKKANISLKDIRYKEYLVSSLKLKIKDLETDLKDKHRANLELDLNSNVTNAHAKISLDDVIKLQANISPKVVFLNKMIKEQNLTIKSISQVNIEASTDMKEVEFNLKNSAILLKYDTFMINPENLKVIGKYDINSGLLDSKTALDIVSDFANIKLNIENQKSTNIMLNALLTPKVENINNILKDKNITMHSSSDITLRVKTDMKVADFSVETKAVKLSIDKNTIMPKDLNLSGNYDINRSKLISNIDLKLLTDLAKLDIVVKPSFDGLKKTFYILGKIESDKNFDIDFDLKKIDDMIVANLATTATKANIKLDSTNNNLDAKLAVSSLKILIGKIRSIYPLEVGDVDGRLDLVLKEQDKLLKVKLDTPYLKVDDLVLKNSKIYATKKDDLIRFSKFDFLLLVKELDFKKHFILKNGGFFNLKTKESSLRFNHGITLSSYTKDKTLNANIKVDKFKVDIKEYGRYTLKTDINYMKKGKFQTIQGDINLNDMYVTYASSAFSPDSDMDIVFVNKKLKESSEDFLKYTKLDIAIKSKKSKYKTDKINIDFDIDMKIKKEFSKPLGVFGKVKNIKGDVTATPKRFKLVNSAIIFQGSSTINPTLDLKVLYNLPQVKITILISGNKARPRVEFKSNPPMPKKDIISYLLFGVSTNSFKSAKGSLSKEATLFVLNQAAQDFAIEFELDRIFFTDDGTPDGMDVEVGKNISKNTMAVVKESKDGNSYILEYEVSDKVRLKLGNHQKTKPSQSIELFYKKKF